MGEIFELDCVILKFDGVFCSSLRGWFMFGYVLFVLFFFLDIFGMVLEFFLEMFLLVLI
ncbi:hypothetical protein JHZ66_28235 [Pseudomonas cannabina pv. alisalensis]|uniref:Uncharacterized protein n=1 Tax=Pseudomonas cannabina pv. alisalensis TaxID=757414 RepID=A0ABS1XM81_PSEC1|nr:hypothetical protein [Pseudomonas cannabina pv. alisalensis]